MFEAIDRKLLNAWVMLDLISLEKKQIPDPEKEKRIQNRRVQKLMKRAYEIPFYRKRFEEAGVSPNDFHRAEDFAKFPLLTKDDFRAWMAEECGKPQYAHYYLDTTSGSSGTPTRVLYSPREKAYNMANWLRVLMKAGYNPFVGKTVSRLCLVTSTNGGKQNILQRMGILRRELVDQYAPEQEVIDSINALKPDMLYMNKTELMRVALYSKQHGCTLCHPKFFAPTGEMIDESSRKLLTDVFGDGLIDSFGTVETGACMAKYPGTSEYRIHSDLFVVNLYDDNNQLTNEGKLTVTPLYKLDIPLINYVVGDKAAARTENGVKYITAIQGRMSDFIRHENGEVTTFYMFSPIVSHCEGVMQLRVRQLSYHELVIEVVMDPDSSKTRKEIEDYLRKGLDGCLRSPMNISFHWMNVIPPDTNGKLRLIVNEMKKA